jgi:hypothetical protein
MACEAAKQIQQRMQLTVHTTTLTTAAYKLNLLLCVVLHTPYTAQLLFCPCLGRSPAAVKPYLHTSPCLQYTCLLRGTLHTTYNVQPTRLLMHPFLTCMPPSAASCAKPCFSDAMLRNGSVPSSQPASSSSSEAMLERECYSPNLPLRQGVYIRSSDSSSSSEAMLRKRAISSTCWQ